MEKADVDGTGSITAWNNRELKILMLEDSERDALLIEKELKDADLRYIVRTVDNEDEFKKSLSEFLPDLVLSDFLLPTYDGFLALEEVRAGNTEIPFVFVSGAIGEDLAIEALKRGATDCVNKNYLGKLPSAVRRAMDEAEEKRLHRRSVEVLERVRKRNLLILDSAADGIAGLDSEWRFVFINRSALAMLGYVVDELFGESFNTVLVNEHDNGGAFPFERVFDGLSSPSSMPVTVQLKKRDGGVFPAELTISTVTDHSGAVDRVVSFRDITERLRAEDEIGNSYKRMRKTLFDGVYAISQALEFRDPYTSGHQKRVADLSVAIASSIGMSADDVDGIYMCGIVHDIGKIHVPAEILSRPSRLTEIEFAIIKVHSESGYQILKNIDFPWPIAEAVYQHHERLDGSGYPRGLSGDEIITVARIITVADVVEAMASHRPYRPALGTEAALAEIKKNAGKLYEGDIVEACLSLFGEGFAFKSYSL